MKLYHFVANNDNVVPKEFVVISNEPQQAVIDENYSYEHSFTSAYEVSGTNLEDLPLDRQLSER